MIFPGLCLVAVLGHSLSSSSPSSEELLVTTPLGDYAGGFVEATTGQPGSCGLFQGIPFALPPTGTRRFRKPEPITEAWDGVRDATEMGPACVQMWQADGGTGAEESEDCLHLAVVLPPGHNMDGEKKAVMVWIHGGGFVVGSGPQQTRPSDTCGILSTRDVIVVFIQYRLGFLGFLASGDSEAPGNIGLWDQVAALSWVQANIVSFGGDVDRVTIFGESAGGVSTSLLTYIPQAQPLYARAIALSGSAFAYWGLNDDSLERTTKMACHLGCTGKTPKMLDCLREKSVRELQAANFALFGMALFKSFPVKGTAIGGGHNMFPSMTFGWNPRVDGDLIPDTPDKLAEMIHPKPLITGSTHSETTLIIAPTPLFKQYVMTKPPLIIENDNVVEATFDVNFEDAVKLMISEDVHPDKVKTITNLGKAVYLDSSFHVSNNKTQLTEKMIRLSSDIWIDVPLLLDAEAKRRGGGSVWVYSLHHFRAAVFPANWTHAGCPHAEDVALLFHRADVTELSADDEAVRNHLADAFATFAKDGEPRIKKIRWETYESLRSPRNLIFAAAPTVSDDFRDPTASFWTLMAPAISQHEAKTEL